MTTTVDTTETGARADAAPADDGMRPMALRVRPRGADAGDGNRSAADAGDDLGGSDA